MICLVRKMLERQLGDEDHGSGMQPSLALGGSSNTTQLHGVEWGVQSLSGCRDMDGVCWDGPETLPDEGTGYNPFPEGTWGQQWFNRPCGSGCWCLGCQLGRTSKSWSKGCMGKTSGRGKKLNERGKTLCVCTEGTEGSIRKRCSKVREMKKP